MGTPKNEIAFREYLQRFKGRKLCDDDREAIERYYTNRGISDVRAKEIRQEVLGALGEAKEKCLSGERSSAEQQPTTNGDAINAGKNGDSSTTETDESKDSVIDPKKDSVIDPKQVQVVDDRLRDRSADTPAPDLSPTYLAHLDEYGQAFLQSLLKDGPLRSKETQARLDSMKEQFGLHDADVVAVEKKMWDKLAERYSERRSLNTGSPALLTEKVEPNVESKEIASAGNEQENYDAELEPFFEELEGSLKVGDLKAADIATFEILREVIKPPQGWFDEVSLKTFKPTNPQKRAIQVLDDLWKQKSNKFGFSRQLKVYGLNHVVNQEIDLAKQQRMNRIHALQFSKKVEWWIPGLEFFKFYRYLDFSMDAPVGHLPARWFWETSRQKAFQHGGLWPVKERGGCGIDPFIIPAFMLMLKRAGIPSSSTSSGDGGRTVILPPPTGDGQGTVSQPYDPLSFE